MATIPTLDYLADYYNLEPSLFRESDNLHRLFQSIFSVCHNQQIDLLWFAENILNIDAAENAHLDFIGKLVGQDRFLIGFNAETYFGFDGAYKSDSFGAVGAPYIGGYWNSRSYFNAATARRLSDDEYRRIIKARIISNHSNCSPNDLLEVINLITDSDDNTVQLLKHGLIQIKTSDKTGILSYFVDRLYLQDNILPIAAGVRVGLLQVVGDTGGGDTGGGGVCVPTVTPILVDYRYDDMPVGQIHGRYRVNGGVWVDFINPNPEDNVNIIQHFFNNVFHEGKPTIHTYISDPDWDDEYAFGTGYRAEAIHGGSKITPVEVDGMAYPPEQLEVVDPTVETTIEFKVTQNNINDLVFLIFGKDTTIKSCATARWKGY